MFEGLGLRVCSNESVITILGDLGGSGTILSGSVKDFSVT